MALTNGRIPDSMLATIPGTAKRLMSPLVPQAAAFRAAFHARFGKPLVITDAYRTFDEQVAVKEAKGSYAATPGTSQHGWGQALDLGSGVQASFTSPEHLWVRENGHRFGVTHPAWAHNHNPSDGQDEPWHVELSYVPPSSYSTAPPTTTTEDDDMPTAAELWNAPIDDPNDRLPAASAYALLTGARQDAGDARAFSEAALTAVRGIAEAVWNAQIERGGLGPAAARDWLADTRIIVGQIASTPAPAGGSVDVAALAAALAKVLPSAVVDVDAADLAAIAKAVQDEQDRRERERLAR